MRSFSVLSEREKETTTHPKSHKDKAREQIKTTRAKNDNERKAKTTGQKAGQKRENERQTRNKSYNRLTIHAYKSPTSHAKHPSNTNPRQTYKTP